MKDSQLIYPLQLFLYKCTKVNNERFSTLKRRELIQA